jgi:transcriptional regulator with XRE-family HTH domain
MVARPITTLVVLARLALKDTQRTFAERLGSSQRTVARWEAGQSEIHAHDAVKLARELYPIDRQMAADLLACRGQTLVSTGIEAPAPPPAALPPAAPAPARPPAAKPELLAIMVDAVVCAAAEAADASPKRVRESVLLVMRRSLEAGLDLQAASDAGLLRPGKPDAAPPAPSDGAG